MIAPEWVAVSSFGRRRFLSNLAVWGFPEFSRKIFPLKPYSTLFLPFDHLLQFAFLSNASLQRFRAVLYQLSLPFSSFRPSLTLYRTSSVHPRNPSIGSPKSPKCLFLGLFRGFHLTLKKG